MDMRTGFLLSQIFTAIFSSIILVIRIYFAFKLVKTAVRKEKKT